MIIFGDIFLPFCVLSSVFCLMQARRNMSLFQFFQMKNIHHGKEKNKGFTCGHQKQSYCWRVAWKYWNQFRSLRSKEHPDFDAWKQLSDDFQTVCESCCFEKSHIVGLLPAGGIQYQWIACGWSLVTRQETRAQWKEKIRRTTECWVNPTFYRQQEQVDCTALLTWNRRGERLMHPTIPCPLLSQIIFGRTTECWVLSINQKIPTFAYHVIQLLFGVNVFARQNTDILN